MPKKIVRDMIGYGSKGVKIVWPNNARIAVQIVLNYEEGAENCVLNGDKNSNACELVSSLTGDNTREVVSFGTEAGLFQEIGISTVVCGPGSIEQAHKIDEFIILDELKKCLNLLEGIKNNSVVN